MSIDAPGINVTPPSAAALPAPAPACPGPAAGPPRGPLRDLEHPRQAFAHLGPNWFTSVMGTGIVGTAAATLPVHYRALHDFATAAWLLAAGWLILLSAAWAVHWARHRPAARRHALDPVMAQFYGAPPMAALTVGSGVLLLGPPLVGMRAAVLADAALWVLGTLTGLASSFLIPYLMFTRHRIGDDAAFGGWLMPLVPPMVSASAGALLIPFTPAGQLRLTLALACYAMFGLSLITSVVVITALWQRLIRYKEGPTRMVPTLWIVLGPLGQSITAANLLGANAHLALPASCAAACAAFGVVYGVPVWGFAALWAALAMAITRRAAREHLPFSLTWWSFTFPVGTCVTGTSGLADHTGSSLFRWGAVALYAGLVTAWAVVAARTTRGGWRGHLFLPADPAPGLV